MAIVVSFDITKGTRGDAPILKKLIKDIPKGIGDFCADPAYLSRDICNMVASYSAKDTIHQTKEEHS